MMDEDDKEVLYLLRTLHSRLHGLNCIKCAVCYENVPRDVPFLEVLIEGRKIYVCRKCEKAINNKKNKRIEF